MAIVASEGVLYFLRHRGLGGRLPYLCLAAFGLVGLGTLVLVLYAHWIVGLLDLPLPPLILAALVAFVALVGVLCSFSSSPSAGHENP
jgi:hypothetical protein